MARVPVVLFGLLSGCGELQHRNEMSQVVIHSNNNSQLSAILPDVQDKIDSAGSDGALILYKPLTKCEWSGCDPRQIEIKAVWPASSAEEAINNNLILDDSHAPKIENGDMAIFVYARKIDLPPERYKYSKLEDLSLNNKLAFLSLRNSEMAMRISKAALDHAVAQEKQIVALKTQLEALSTSADGIIASSAKALDVNNNLITQLADLVRKLEERLDGIK